MIAGSTVPLVSFIIPAFNAAKSLERALQSLQSQTESRWEAIIVDDGSRDATARLARRACSRDARLYLVRQPNGGPSTARNRGLQEASADRIVFLDADDWIEPQFLETLLPLGDAETRLAYCGYRRTSGDGLTDSDFFCPDLMTRPLFVLALRCEPAIHCVIVPRKMLERVGGFDKDMRCCEDWDLWLRIARAGGIFVGAADSLAVYFMRGASLSTNSSEGERNEQLVIARARSVDKRLPDNAPFREPLEFYQREEDAKAALSDALTHVLAGDPADNRWFVKNPDHWADAALRDPAVFYHLGKALGEQWGSQRADAAMAGLLEQLGKVDPTTAEALADAADLARAKAADGRFGRYLSVSVDPFNIPGAIVRPSGTDMLVVKVALAGEREKLLMLTFEQPINRTRLANLILRKCPVVPLMRRASSVRVWRVWYDTLASLFSSALQRPSGFLRYPKLVLVRAARIGVARSLEADMEIPPISANSDLQIPVLLIPRITIVASEILDESLGQGQLADLDQILTKAGHEPMLLNEIASLSSSPEPQIRTPFGLAFTDYQSARELGISVIGHSCDILLRPDEIMQDSFPGLNSNRDVPVRYGLIVESLPNSSAAALDHAASLHSALQTINGDRCSVAAMSRNGGVDDAILEEAGFAPILTSSMSLHRIAVPDSVMPGIECSGSESLGNMVECLRAA